MIILCGPSASGKTEVAKLLASKYNIKKAVTNTTRPIRINEVNHVDYHFTSKEEFLELASKDYFVETACYNNNYYGCAKNEVADNKAVILEPQGVANFLKLNDPHIVVFVLMCSEVTRYNRMVYRGDLPESIEERIRNDRIAFSNDKLSFADYTIDTDDKTLMEITDLVYELYNNKINCL
mgnify:CR=1 FL=1